MTSARNSSAIALKEKVNRLIEVGELDSALRLIHAFVTRIITEPLCTSQFYGSKDMDILCQRIGVANRALILRNNAIVSAHPENYKIIAYIVTKLQRSGGHSRVIEDFVKARPNVHHIILSTELDGKSDAAYLEKGTDTLTNVFFERAPKVNFQQRLSWLQQRLIEINPQKVYLFNHHQDSVAVAAIPPEMELDVSFYHHGDHHLCLGMFLPHLEHIDPHPMGYNNCRNALGIQNIYIPLTVDDKGDRPDNLSFLGDGILTTCTAARSNKIEIPYYVSYLDIIPKLLKLTGGRHIHIGQLSPWALMKLRIGLKRYGVYSDQLIYMPWVPSVWKALHEYKVDLYIASFPYGGGLTLIEAMGSGTPVALHKHIFSKILSGTDLSYPGAFSWRLPESLFEFCSTLTREYLSESGRSARIQYLKFHRREVLEGILNNSQQAHFTPENLKEDFLPDNDEWACWMENQISLRRITRRSVYRIYKSIRAKFHI